MKQFLVALALLFNIASFSQAEIADLYVGDMIDIDNISIEFVELISDSRCPQGVNCIRAGEAEVLVAIYKNGTFLHEKKLTFYANGFAERKNMQLFAASDLLVRGLTLSPYPSGLSKIRNEEYVLAVAIN